MTQKHIEEALSLYQPTDAAIEEMALDFEALTVEGLEDKTGLALVHKARMEVKGIRVQVEKTRVELKKDALAFGRAVDGEAKRITGMLQPIEDGLWEKESIVEAEKLRLAEIEEEKKREVLQERIDAFRAVEFAVNPLLCQEWTVEEFVHALEQATLEHVIRKREDAEKAAEEAERQATAKQRMEEMEARRLKAEKDLEEERQRANQVAKEALAERNKAEAQLERLRKEAEAEVFRLQGEVHKAAQKSIKEELAKREKKEAARRQAMLPHVRQIHIYALSFRQHAQSMPEGLPKDMAAEVYQVVEGAYLEILERWPLDAKVPRG